MPCKLCGGALTPKIENLFDDRYGYPGKFSVGVCTACGFGQTAPIMPVEKFTDLYTNYYPRKTVTGSQVKAAAQTNFSQGFRFKEWLLGKDNICHYFIQPQTKVLDVGCGNGVSLLEIQAQGAEAYGTEEDRNIEAVAKDLKLNIFFGQLEQAQIPDNFFNFITLSQVLEHVAEPIKTLQLLKTKLNSDGEIILSFPNFNSLHLKYSGRQWINWHLPYHQNFFNTQSIQELLNKTGLKLVQQRTVTPFIWNELQWQNIIFRSKVGQASKVWAVDKKLSFTDKLIFATLHALSLLFIPTQRILDALGYGDSIIIRLKKA